MTRFMELGRAVTHGQALPLGVDDPVTAARAVRRALAAAHRRAVDVDEVVVVTTEPVPEEVLEVFVRRALGPHGAAVRTRGILSERLDATSLTEIGDTDDSAPDATSAAIVIVVGIGGDGTTEARCLAARLPAASS